MTFEVDNYFSKSPLSSNIKFIEKVIADNPQNTSISNRWLTAGHSGPQPSLQPVFGSDSSSIFGSAMSYFGTSSNENSRASFDYSNFMPESTFAPFFDFKNGFASLARQSDLDNDFQLSPISENNIGSHLTNRMHSLSFGSDKSVASSSSNDSPAFETFAVRRKAADSTAFGWIERQDKEPNSEKPDSSSECCGSSGGRPILGRNASYFDKYGINTFPVGQEMPTNFEYSLTRRIPKFMFSKPKPVRVLKKECVFCKRLGKPDYSSHWLKTSRNVVTCPLLRTFKCSICGCQGGDNAHTYR